MLFLITGALTWMPAKRKRNVVKNLRKKANLTVSTVQSFSLVKEILIANSIPTR